MTYEDRTSYSKAVDGDDDDDVDKKSTKKKQRHQDDEDESKASKKSSSSKPRVDFKEHTTQHVSSLFTANPETPVLDMPKPSSYAAHGSVFSQAEVANLPIHPHLIGNLTQRMKLESLTLIQRLAIPRLLSSEEDALIKSPTGSGKTLAYAIPLIHQLQAIEPRPSRSDGPLAIILTPTRELAIQTMEVLQKLVYSYVWIVPGVIMGGEKKKAEKARLRKGLSIVIATPGRLVDHIETTGALSFKNVRWLVLDEADRSAIIIRFITILCSCALV